MKSRHQSQLSLGPLQLRDSEQRADSFRISEQDDEAFGKAERASAEILNEAFEGAALDNKEIAHLCGVSVSLVEKWRSAEARGCPSFVQMLRLPFSFHWHLHKALNRRFGFGKHALAQLLEAAGMLAVGMER